MRRSAALAVVQSATLVSAPPAPKSIYISGNSKTGSSVNVSIEESCVRRTRDCDRYCYGKYGPISFGASVGKQRENFARFEYLETASKREVDAEADRVFHRIYPEQDFIRFFGVGDLQPGSVRLIAALSRRYPDLRIWVAARNADLAADLPKRQNLHVMLSVDASTRPGEVRKIRALVASRAPEFFAAYVKQAEDDEPPPWVSVIFHQHTTAGRRATWSEEDGDPRSCPATVRGKLEHEGACANCRRCFDAEKRDP